MKPTKDKWEEELEKEWHMSFASGDDRLKYPTQYYIFKNFIRSLIAKERQEEREMLANGIDEKTVSFLFKKALQAQREEIRGMVEGMKKNEAPIVECPECKGVGHLGHDMSDTRPEHIENGECQTCPVACPACEGKKEIEYLDFEKVTYNKALDDIIKKI